MSDLGFVEVIPWLKKAVFEGVCFGIENSGESVNEHSVFLVDGTHIGDVSLGCESFRALGTGIAHFGMCCVWWCVS